MSVVVGLIVALGMIGATAAPASADPPPNPDRYHVQANLKLSRATEGYRTIPLRKGYYRSLHDQGFGWRKIYFKHNIRSVSAVGFVTKSPRRVKLRPYTAKRWKLTAYANKLRCNPRGCVVEKTIKVEQIIYFGRINNNPRNGPFGVNTQYCVGYNPKCPNWVTTALARGGRSAAQAVDKDGYAYTASYRPY